MSKHHTFTAGVAFALVALSPGWRAPASEEQQPVKYYVQLIRGNDANTPTVPGSKPVDEKLGQKLHSVFKWKSYWEINRLEVKMVFDQKTKVRLSKEREVEIDLTESGKRKVTVFQDGKPLDSATRSLGEAMTVIGGDRDAKSVWFIVVRRDQPRD